MEEQTLSVEREEKVVALPSIDDEVIFAISARPDEPEEAVLLYDGGEHALLYRGQTEVVLLDYLNSEVQDMLLDAHDIYVTEIDYSRRKLVRDYQVLVRHVKAYPFDVTEFLD